MDGLYKGRKAFHEAQVWKPCSLCLSRSTASRRLSSLPGALPDQITTAVQHRHRHSSRSPEIITFSGDTAYADPIKGWAVHLETPAWASHSWVSHPAKFGSSAIRISPARVLVRWIRSGATWGGSSSKRSHQWWWWWPHRSPRPPAVRTVSASSTCSPRSRSSKKLTVTGLTMLWFRWPCAVFCSLLDCFGYVISWRILCLCACDWAVPVRTSSEVPYRLQMFKIRMVYASDVRKEDYEVIFKHSGIAILCSCSYFSIWWHQCLGTGGRRED